MFGKIQILLSFLALVVLSGCLPDRGADEDTPPIVAYRLGDSIFQEIISMQNRQDIPALLDMTGHRDPTLRYLSAQAFASIRDASTLDSLFNLLFDDNALVRSMAAYSIGQIGNGSGETHLIEAFQQVDTGQDNRLSNRFILEAVGKCGSDNSLVALATISTYQPSDTMLLLGQVYGIYRFALRGMTTPEGTETMLRYMQDRVYPQAVRVVAANYLSRARDIQLEDHYNTILDALLSEQDPKIRMCLVSALAKTGNSEAIVALTEVFDSETDYRIKCNIVKTLDNFSFAQTRPLVEQAVRDDNLQVARTAADFIFEHGDANHAGRIRDLSRGDLPWLIRVRLLSAANKFLHQGYAINKSNIRNTLLNLYNGQENPVLKGYALYALHTDVYNLDPIIDAYNTSSEIPVKTAALRGIAGIVRDPGFRTQFSAILGGTYQKVASVLMRAVETQDVAAIGILSSLVSEENAISGYLDRQRMQDVLQGMSPASHPEVYSDMEALVSNLNDGQGVETAVRRTYSSPDWTLLSSLDSIPTLEINTTRGSFRVQLFPREAPATVSHFVRNVQDGSFTGLYFHRVVPNFVIQTGCPRGDGYGTQDTYVRSELGPSYYDDQGYLGMASSGNHTESSQWFVTHSPTPHLDGNYTIFGKVTVGMDVVHQIGLGDQILSINLQ